MARIVKALALASLGWYLMLPPCVHDQYGNLQYLDNAPLTSWHVLVGNDTAAECEVALMRIIEDPTTPASSRFYALKGQCISTDDPRLAR